MSVDVVIVIPTRKEFGNLKYLIEELFRLTQSRQEVFHVIVVDHGEDLLKIKEILHKYREMLTVVEQEVKTGYASALLQGLQLALKCRPDYIIQMDAGFTHKVADIPRLLTEARSRDYGLVTGTRFEEGLEYKGFRTFLSLSARFLMGLLGIKTTDVSCGFRCWEYSKVKNILDWHTLKSKGFAIQLEMLYLAYNDGLDWDIKICTVPIEYKLTNSTINLKIVLEAIKIYCYLVEDKIRRIYRAWIRRIF